MLHFHDLNISQRPHLPLPSHWALRFPHLNLGERGDTNIQIIAVIKIKQLVQGCTVSKWQDRTRHQDLRPKILSPSKPLTCPQKWSFYPSFCTLLRLIHSTLPLAPSPRLCRFSTANVQSRVRPAIDKAFMSFVTKISQQPINL